MRQAMSVEMEWMDRNPPVHRRDKGEVHSVDCLCPNESMEGDIDVVVRSQVLNGTIDRGFANQPSGIGPSSSRTCNGPW